MANFNYNKSIIAGRLTEDIEVKKSQSGLSVCTFSIAVNRKAKKDGKRETDFIRCVAWKDQAEFIAKYFKKGSSICVTGPLQVRTWEDKNKLKHVTTELIVNEVEFVDSKSENAKTDFEEVGEEPLPY